MMKVLAAVFNVQIYARVPYKCLQELLGAVQGITLPVDISRRHRFSETTHIKRRPAVYIQSDAGKRLFHRHRDIHRPEPAYTFRSEEHTSELQSQSNLVCRLLL